MNKNDQAYLVEKIRTQYTEPQHTELDSLKELDRRVKKPANICAYTLGTISALVLGCGMSLLMTDINETLGIAVPTVPGIVIGVVGIALAIANYPIYKHILANRRKKYADEIIRLSDSLLKN